MTEIQMTTTQIITKSAFDAGTYTDLDCVKSYVDTAKLRRKLNMKGQGKILAVFVQTYSNPEFINVANKDVVFKSPCCCRARDAGAEPSTYVSGMWQYHNPVGNVIIVVK